MAKSGNKPVQSIGFWHMVRDVLVASINKGQFPIAVVGIIFLVMIVKMPAEDVSKLADKILDDLKTLHLLGYILAALVVILWYKHAQLLRTQLLTRTENPNGSSPASKKVETGAKP